MIKAPNYNMVKLGTIEQLKAVFTLDGFAFQIWKDPELKAAFDNIPKYMESEILPYFIIEIPRLEDDTVVNTLVEVAYAATLVKTPDGSKSVSVIFGVAGEFLGNYSFEEGVFVVE